MNLILFHFYFQSGAAVSAQVYGAARSGVMRSGAARMGYYPFLLRVQIDGTERTTDIEIKTLEISSSISDEPSTCRFQLKKPNTFTVFTGHEVVISYGSISNKYFGGQIETLRYVPRGAISHKPTLEIYCTDYTRLFDRQRVTRNWINSTATRIALDIVQDHTDGFSTGAIQIGLQNIESFPAMNASPSELLRRLSVLIAGGYYLDAYRKVHLFAGHEPRSPSPIPISSSNPATRNFGQSYDRSQLRTKVICEGRRTETLLTLPMGYNYDSGFGFLANYIPIDNAEGFGPGFSEGFGTGAARVGTQRMPYLRVTPSWDQGGENKPGTTLVSDANPGDTEIDVDSVQWILDSLSSNGGPNSDYTHFIRVGDQVIFWGNAAYGIDPDTDAQFVEIPASGFGCIGAPIKAGATVTPIGSILTQESVDLEIPRGSEVVLYATAEDTVTQAAVAAIEGGDGVHEDVVTESDGDYLSVLARAEAELAIFKNPVVEAEWETWDLGCIAGRPQEISMTASDGLATTLTITRVRETFQTYNHRPDRSAVASDVKLARLLDVVSADRR